MQKQNFNQFYFGWRYNYLKNQAVIKKRSQLDFLISIIIAFLIIVIVSQILVQVDHAIRFPLSGKVFSLLNPFEVKVANAAVSEAQIMIQSQNSFQVVKRQSFDFTIGFKNLGNKVWEKTSTGKVDLRREDKSGLTLKTTLSTNENKPGEIGYYTMKLYAPTTAGIYKFKYVLVRNGKEKISGSEFEITLNVVNSKSVTSANVANLAVNKNAAQNSTTTAEAQIMIQSQNSFQVVKSQTFDLTVGFKNLGSKIWEKTSTGKVDLRREDKSGLTLKTTLSTNENKPGEIGYYTMKLYAPTTAGTYKFKYVLVRNGTEKISGSEFEITLNVVNSQSEIKTSGASLAVSQSNQTAAIVAPQKIDPTKPVGLAEICLSIKPGDFKATSVDKLLLAQCLTIGIKVTEAGTSYVQIDLPVSVTSPITNDTNNNNNNNNNSGNQTSNPNVTPTPSPILSSNGPLIRVGLFNTTEPITITANSVYKIKDQNQAVLVTVPANIQSTVNFNFSTRTYTLTANGTNLATSSYLRFEGQNSGTVFEIVSLSWRPGWNQSLNDNKFLGSLDVRYSANTGRLWVINELEIEDYLKGLAESSNYSPMEYQKALITAARTYAMYHYNRGTKHADEYFTLDATYDQVYRGYNSQLRLTQVIDAVEQTKGQVVTYNGEVVVTPYFSYDDGRTRSYQEVWGGSFKPWLVSVKEQAGYDKTTMYGHGVGLCARGAVLLASDYNYTFDRILKYYYTGVDLKKIY